MTSATFVLCSALAGLTRPHVPGRPRRGRTQQGIAAVFAALAARHAQESD